MERTGHRIRVLPWCASCLTPVEHRTISEREGFMNEGLELVQTIGAAMGAFCFLCGYLIPWLATALLGSPSETTNYWAKPPAAPQEEVERGLTVSVEDD